MSVKASPELIRGMEKEIADTIRDIKRICSVIKTGTNAVSGWDDAKAAEFNMLMRQIAQLTAAPVETLTAALPKLERLAQSLDEYNRVKF